MADVPGTNPKLSEAPIRKFLRLCNSRKKHYLSINRHVQRTYGWWLNGPWTFSLAVLCRLTGLDVCSTYWHLQQQQSAWIGWNRQNTLIGSSNEGQCRSFFF
jgi:hypothetical protein